MGLLDGLKKKKEDASGSAQDLPIDQVLTMQQQGLTNNQIMQALGRGGYSSQQIYDALSQAEAHAAVGPSAPSPGSEIPPLPEMNVEASESDSSDDDNSSARKAPEEMEELVESVVDEKWKEFEDEMGRMAGWRDKVEERLAKLEQSSVDIQQSLNNLQKGVLGKVSEYDRNLLDVGTEIKAMEKVFQQVLPELTGSVQELSRLAKNAKAKK